MLMKPREQMKREARTLLKTNWPACFLACMIPTAINMLGTTVLKQLLREAPTIRSLAEILLTLFVTMPLSFALCGYFLGFVRDEKRPNLASVFASFRTDTSKIIKTGFFLELRVFGWFLLSFFVAALVIVLTMALTGLSARQALIVGMPLLALSALFVLWRYVGYVFTPYLVNDRPELSGNAAIRKSLEMTRNTRNKLMVSLYLSFFTWYMIPALVFGVYYVMKILESTASWLELLPVVALLAGVYVVPYQHTVEAKYYLAYQKTKPKRR